MEISDSRFKDQVGRTVMLRGINVAGSSKIPSSPDGATHRREGFFDHRNLSFVGRPFPRETTPEHLERLRHWGFNTLRLLVPWEALEHAGPGQHDEAFLDSIVEVVEAAQQRGMQVIIDPHQDVWSRFSGGDGAPGWTLEAVGFQLEAFRQTEAALLHQLVGPSLEHLMWPSNATRLAAATMFTLFFGGSVFAPRTTINGEPAQEVLQEHYLNAFAALARRLRGCSNVLGYEVMNEPLPGFIGCPDIRQPFSLVPIGPVSSPLQAMALGAGIPQQLRRRRWGHLGSPTSGGHWVNPEGRRAWQPGVSCLWQENGLWTPDDHGAPRALRPSHFAQHQGRPVEFVRQFFSPFVNRFTRLIRQAHPKALVFVPDHWWHHRHQQWRLEDTDGLVFAPHWYDGFVLFLRWFSPWIALDAWTQRFVLTPRAIAESFSQQLRAFQDFGKTHFPGAPVFLGECGIPFNINNHRMFRSGDFHVQAAALDRTFRAIEANLLNYALWNYSPDNTNEHGDNWNKEDLSVFSLSQRDNPTDINSGARALEAFVRPYPSATAGKPMHLSFDYRKKFFEYRFRHEMPPDHPTEIFVPQIHFGQGCRVFVSDGRFELDMSRQQLRYWHTMGQSVHTVRLSVP